MQSGACICGYQKEVRIPESGIPRIEEEPGPVVYAVLQREPPALELVVWLMAGYTRPFHRAHGNRGFHGETGCLSFFIPPFLG
jgi:hypothetical protein